MPRFYRYRREGGTYFFTVVTYRRRRILTTARARRHLRRATEAVRRHRPFDIVAFVLLPDHLHTVWRLPDGDSDFSTRWQLIKRYFTRLFLASGGMEAVPSESMIHQGHRGIWQRRFWEHFCRSDTDLRRHVNYVHWNPVKHGLVARVADWPWSSFHRYVRGREYPPDWGGVNPCPDLEAGE